MSITSEPLHTCTACGQTGFTAGGLKSHQGNKTCKSRALVKTEPAKAVPALMKEFAQARKYVADIRDFGRRAQHVSLLLGFELNKVKTALGIKAGRPSGKLPHGAEIKSWEDLVTEQTGLSMDTCDRWMKIATGASKSLPILTAPDLLKKPFSALPAARQAEVEKALHKAVDGQTMAQMMINFGVWKEKKLNHPPKATKASAKKRAENAADETLQAAQLIALHEEHINYLGQITLAAAFKVADTERLAAMENALTALHEAVSAELKLRRKAK